MNDRELNERFAELRDEERRLVPPFGAPASSQAGPAASRRRLVLAFAMAMAIAGIFLLRPRETTTFTRADREAARSLSAWRPSTDFLLRTPGSDLLASVPDIPSNDLPKGVSR